MYGQRIRELRKELKLTAKHLGIKLSLAESTISGYENETRKPDIETLNKMATLFEVSVDYLTGRTDTRERNTDQISLAKVKPLSDSNTGGRAFFGGADQYTEEELEIADAAAKAAVEAYRRGKANGNKND